MSLRDLTDKQLERVWRKCWDRLRSGAGYQPFGFDWPTLRVNRPGLHDVMQSIMGESLDRAKAR